MDPFHHKRKTIDFFIVTGQVSGVKKWSETRVRSYGGGGYVSSDRGGYVSAPTVYSTVTTKLEFFLIKPNGGEVPIQLTNVDVPLRDGQKVSMIGGVLRSNKDISYWMLLLNHNTDRYLQVLDGESILKLYKLERGIAIGSCLISTVFGAAFVVFTGAGIAMNMTANHHNLLAMNPQVLSILAICGCLTGIFLIDYLGVRRARKNAIELIRSHLMKVANQGFYEAPP